jgi:hypothetical protein
MQQKLNQAKVGKKGAAMKWVTISAVVVVVAVGGFFAYGPIKDWWAKRSEASNPPSSTPTQEVAGATAPDGTAVAPAPEKELPVVAPTWTLDVDKATIPTSKVNGLISGSNFLAETAMCIPVPATLRLFQGPSGSPDLEICIFLHLNAGESPVGRTVSVSQDMRDHSVPQVIKRWKTNPKYAPQSKAFSSGYAMKLELGELANGVVPGKIYLALPDTEQTVVAGMFKAMTILPNPNGAAAAFPGMAPGPGAGQLPPGASRAASERYGGRRR